MLTECGFIGIITALYLLGDFKIVCNTGSEQHFLECK